MRPSPQWVERSFSNGYFPKWEHFWSSFTPVLPFAVGDVVAVVGILIVIAALVLVRPWWRALLGIAACTLLGIAVSSLAPNRRSASALISPLALLLEFISGVFEPFDRLPHWMQLVSSLFPVKWMAQGMRSVFLPHALAAKEPAGSWELGRTALVLGIWCVVGLVLCLRTFRWQERGDR